MPEKDLQVSESTKEDARADKPVYAPPVIRAMDENEVLKAFQVTSASISWWVA